MTAVGDHALELHLRRRVHPGLELDVGLTLGREIGVVFGPSGAGKTSLLRLIAGLEVPDEGHLRIEGETLFEAEARVNRPLRSRRISMVFQDDLLFPHLDVAGNIRYGMKGLDRSCALRRLGELAELCGVSSLLGRRPVTLSGGERQRVGLARALAPRPKLLLCDEPFSALDRDSRDSLVSRLRAVQAAEAVPVLYVTHSPDEAVALGTRLFLIDHGRMVREGLPLDVLAASGPGLSGALEGVRNVFAAEVDGEPGGTETVLKLDGGVKLIVPRVALAPGSRVIVAVFAEEILLALGPVQGLSARNVIGGKVARVLAHGNEAEVLVQTEGLTWIASVVAPAVTALGLKPGVAVHMIIKARSCHVQAQA
ncbi:MAG: molybdenum ABC transporter ATP-binding protein [Isosphaeraceae bacterium]